MSPSLKKIPILSLAGGLARVIIQELKENDYPELSQLSKGMVRFRAEKLKEASSEALQELSYIKVDNSMFRRVRARLEADQIKSRHSTLEMLSFLLFRLQELQTHCKPPPPDRHPGKTRPVVHQTL